MSDNSDSYYPTWDSVKGYVRYALEPADEELFSADAIYDQVADSLCKVFVYTDEDGELMTWVDEDALEFWGITPGTLRRQAEKNVRNLIEQTRLDVHELMGVEVGTLIMRQTKAKSALILSPAFRHVVESRLGFPVYGLVPCRDFVFLVATEHWEFLPQLGNAVVMEYFESTSPISLDVFEISTEGITSVGTFSA